jgi:DNA-directed RNA polymerase specialized sigma24 family protein
VFDHRDERSDSELLVATADGDRTALETLYVRHAPWLMARLSRRCADRSLVDEVVQDTFVEVWRSARRWSGRGEVGAWIWGIGVHRLLDRLRRPPRALSALGAVGRRRAAGADADGGVRGDHGRRAGRSERHRRWSNAREAGLAAGPAILGAAVFAALLPGRWAMFATPGGDAWRDAHLRWAAVLALASAVLFLTLRDPAQRKVTR